MRLNYDFDRPSDHKLASTQTSVNKLIGQVVESRENNLRNANITLETDLVVIDAVIDHEQIHQAVHALIDHSMASMPDGGQLSVSLLDCDLHWELEVADSSGVDPIKLMSISEREQRELETSSVRAASLPNLQPAQPGIGLRVARQIATRHRGQLQSWSCPHGGQAHVLVIPHQQGQHTSMT